MSSHRKAVSMAIAFSLALSALAPSAKAEETRSVDIRPLSVRGDKPVREPEDRTGTVVPKSLYLAAGIIANNTVPTPSNKAKGTKEPWRLQAHLYGTIKESKRRLDVSYFDRDTAVSTHTTTPGVTDYKLGDETVRITDRRPAEGSRWFKALASEIKRFGRVAIKAEIVKTSPNAVMLRQPPPPWPQRPKEVVVTPIQPPPRQSAPRFNAQK